MTHNNFGADRCPVQNLNKYNVKYLTTYQFTHNRLLQISHSQRVCSQMRSDRKSFLILEKCLD